MEAAKARPSQLPRRASIVPRRRRRSTRTAACLLLMAMKCCCCGYSCCEGCCGRTLVHLAPPCGQRVVARKAVVLAVSCAFCAFCGHSCRCWASRRSNSFLPWLLSPHIVTLSPRHLVTLSPRHLVTSSPCHLVTSSPCHLVTLSPCHLVTLSPCHLVTASPCQPFPLWSPPAYYIVGRRSASTREAKRCRAAEAMEQYERNQQEVHCTRRQTVVQLLVKRKRQPKHAGKNRDENLPFGRIGGAELQ